MFTGIIEEVGKIKKTTRLGAGAVIEIVCERVISDVKTGDSIAVNGACLTVRSLTPKSFTADASEETLSRTSLRSLALGRPVNLERALKADARFGGHIVLGHVDGLGRLTKILRKGDFWDIFIEVPQNLRKFIAEKGSVAVDGISLTVAEDLDSGIKVAVIPHAFSSTNLSALTAGDSVNIEVDIVARYLEKLLKCGQRESSLYRMLSGG